jgi:FHA domain-containing protein
MKLVIRAHTLKSEPLSQAITGQFDERGGTIGRSDSNTMTLPDAQRHVSRLQAEVSFVGGSFYLRNVGSSNALVLNGRSIGPGEGGPIGQDDELVIGGYAMRASVDGAAAGPSTAGRAARDARTVISASAGEPRTDAPRQASGDARGGRLEPVAPSHWATPAPLQAPEAGRSSSSASAPASASASAPMRPPPPAAQPLADPFADLFAASAGPQGTADVDPFADLLGPSSSGPSLVPSSNHPPAGLPALSPNFAHAPASAVFPPSAASGSSGSQRSFEPASPASAAPWPASQPPASDAPHRLPDDFDPFADLAAPASSGGADGARSGAPSGTPARTPSGAAAASTDAALADFMAGAAPSARPNLPTDLGFGDLLGPGVAGQAAGVSGGAGVGINTMFGLRSDASEGADPLKDFLAPVHPDGSAASTDLLAAFDAQPPATHRPAARPASPDHTPALASAYAPPRLRPDDQPQTVPAVHAPAPPRQDTPMRPQAAPRLARAEMPAHSPQVASPVPMGPMTPMAAMTPQSSMPPMPPMAPMAPTMPTLPAAPHDALWQAFCDGAGISAMSAHGGPGHVGSMHLTPELMRQLGQLLHHSVEGTLKLVAVRTASKQELRAQVTTIQSRGNNPLKFSAEAQSAIAQLLQPPLRGFMPGPQAMREVMDDLLGHHIGTLAGMRAALEGVLERFEPGQLDAKLAAAGVLDALLPMNRRARLWDLYVQHYRSIHEEAQEDFHELFGKAFIKAYEEQLDRLDEARRAEPGQAAAHRPGHDQGQGQIKGQVKGGGS